MSDGERRVSFPDGVDGAEILAPLNHSAWRTSGEYRRHVTRCSPLLFAITYLGHYLRLDGRMSFSEFHLDAYARARHWIRPERARAGDVAPRGAAKSVLYFLALPLWALAHGHRRFLLGFAYTTEQAVGQLANLRMELDANELLRADFPGLAPRRVRGARATATDTVLASGATIAARGLKGTSLGIRSGADRPDLIVGDDLEPAEAEHSPETKAKIVSRLVDGILPMGGPTAVVQLAGTTTMAGSLVHDLVRAALGEPAAPWIVEHGFTPHYYPAVLDEGTERERSLWPQRWPLSPTHLGEHRRGTRSWWLNMMNRPDLGGGEGFWAPELFVVDPRVPVTRRVLYVDPAMTNNRRSDQTALVVVGVDAAGRRAVVEHAEAGSLHGVELRERIWSLVERHPRTLREVVVEANQGGDRWREILRPLPQGVRLDLEHVSGSKRSRLEVALDHYQRGAVVHARRLPVLEDQALAWSPAADRDDVLDALAGALRRVFA